MAFHTQYRPRTLKTIIGHESEVATLRGYISSGKYPSAILFLGSPSAGKSTLARAFAREVLGGSLEGNKYFSEFDLSQNRTMEDIRGINALARLRIGADVPRRIIFMEEFQGILGSPGAANAFLNTLENPPAHTMFILVSMETEKFSGTKLGSALSGRCTRFNLKNPTVEDLKKQAKRIIRREEMTYISDAALNLIVKAEGQTYRDVANTLEGAFGLYQGLKTKPEYLSEDQIGSVLVTSVDRDDELAAKIILAAYHRDYQNALAFALEAVNPTTFLMKMCSNCQYALNVAVLNGKKPPRMWISKFTYAMVSKLRKSDADEMVIRELARINSYLIDLKVQAGAFSVNEIQALSSALYKICYGKD